MQNTFHPTQRSGEESQAAMPQDAREDDPIAELYTNMVRAQRAACAKEQKISDSVQIEIGRLYFGVLRDYLNAAKLRGMDILWHEGEGWFSRQFTIAGAANDVAHIRMWLQQMVARLAAYDAEQAMPPPRKPSMWERFTGRADSRS